MAKLTLLFRIPLVRSLTLFQEIIISETILNSQSSYLRKRFDTPQQLSQAFKDQGGRLLSILDSSSGSSGGGSSDGEQVQDEDCDAFKTTAPTPHQAPASFLNQLDGPADDREDVWNNSNKDAEYHPPPPPPLSRKRSSTRDKRKQVVGSRRMKLNEDDVAETKDYSIQDINKEHEREAETKRHLDHVYELLCEIVDQENESPKEDVQLEAVIAPQSTMCSSLINDAVNTDGRFWELHVQSSDLGASHYDYHCSPQLPHESFLGGSNSDLLSGYENIEERRNMKTPFLNHCQDSANTATLPPLFLQSHTLKQQQDKLDISQAPPSVCRSRTDSGIGQVENKDDGTCLPSPSAHLSTRFDDLDFFFASSYPL